MNNVLRATGQLRAMDHSTDGAIPSTWRESLPQIERLAPQTDEHTADVLRECGYTGEGNAATARA